LNNYGQLGCDPDGVHGKQVDLPHRIVDLECGKQVGVICAVSGGEHHSLVMSLSGNVYSFGRGDAGELGWKEADDAKGRVNSGYFAWKPQRVGSNLKNYAIKQINCGSHHNIAVAIGGENVFAWYVGGVWVDFYFVRWRWWWWLWWWFCLARLVVVVCLFVRLVVVFFR
jgi:regulator of chromosome condensation